jgi:Flp pilus assembly protein TadD
MIPFETFLVCVIVATGSVWWRKLFSSGFSSTLERDCFDLVLNFFQEHRQLVGKGVSAFTTRHTITGYLLVFSQVFEVSATPASARLRDERGSVNPRLMLWGIIVMLLIALAVSGFRERQRRPERSTVVMVQPISTELAPFSLESLTNTPEPIAVQPLVPEPEKGYEHFGEITKLQRPLDMPSSFATAPPEPLDTAGYLERALSRFNRFNYTGAIADCTKAIELSPQSSLPYRMRAYAELAYGDLQAAIEDGTRAIDLNPQQHDAYYVRGTARQFSGDFEGALADLNRAIQLDPKNPGPYNARAWTRFRKGDMAGAIEDATESLTIAPSGADAYDTRAWAKFASGDIDGAMADCRSAIHHGGNSQAAMTSRGLAWYVLGDYAGALAEWNRAITTMPVIKIALAPWIAKAQQRLAVKEQ